MSTYSIVAIVLGVFGVLLVLAGLRSLWQVRIWRFTTRTLGGLLLLAIGALAGTIGIGIEGFQALTRETLVARVTVVPIGPQRFEASFSFPGSHRARYELMGDELYVDAHILKWSPRANLLGLHTMYELDRVAGRYRSVDQERSATRTVHPLGLKRQIDLFDLRRKYAVLAPLLDAEYGSASFAPADAKIELELYVSTSGLLFRPKSPG